MKKILQLFFIGLLVFVTYRNIPIVLADEPDPEEGPVEFERLSDKKLNKYCPEPGNPNLVSICGVVTQALASPMVFSDGSSAPSVSQVPVEGVSVYLYECDNTSRTCKRDGLLVHPFSSTSTNKDGLFHLLGRKLENPWFQEYLDQYRNDPNIKDDVTVTNQSKKRYLVFKCGNYFQGIHIIPSYVNLTEVIHEVNCPKEYLPSGTDAFEYIEPFMQFDFVGGVKLAAQMGVDPEDKYYPLQTGSHVNENNSLDGSFEGIETTIQAHYDRYATQTNQSVPIILEGADPRFTKNPPSKLDAIKASNIWTNLTDKFVEMIVPTLGAWYSEDCVVQYKKLSEDFLNLIPDWSYLCHFTEDDLYTEYDYTTATLLPALPPKQSILYYRPLEIRNEISGYYQDNDDLAKFSGMMFANPVGGVYKREWEKTLTDEEKPTYPNCELYKAPNNALGTSDGGLNTLTANGIAQGFMAPGSLNNLYYESEPNTPICLITGEEKPVLLSEIQRPGQICEEGMRLCDGGAYWNNYFLTNLGTSNSTLQFGLAGENKEDSYSRKTTEEGEVSKDGRDINNVPLAQQGEGGGEPEKPVKGGREVSARLTTAGGQGAVANAGDVSGNNSGKAVTSVTGIPSGSEIVPSTENLANIFGQPYADEESLKEISGGLPYYISTRPVAWGQFSKTNEYPDAIITSGSHDSGTDTDGDGEIDIGGYLDSYAFNNEMKCESCGDEHYPEDIFNNEINIRGGSKWGGSRTPFEGITVTTAAENRIEKLSIIPGGWRDRLDSAISVSTGHSYIDWGMVKVKGRPKNTIIGFLDAVFTLLFRTDNLKENKTFTDRNPKSLEDGVANSEFKNRDELVAYGFKVNEGNFTTLFPMPTAIDSCGSEVWDAGCWGNDGGTGCYPWHSLPPGESCDTAKEEGIYSRTCRLDTCKSGKITWTFDCTLDSEGNFNEPSNVVTKLEDVYGNNYRCTAYTRDQCMKSQKQTVNGEIPPNSPTCDRVGVNTEEYEYDYCLVARAGPNECDGNIQIDSEVQVYSQTIYDQDEINSPKSYNVDSVADAGLNLYNAFRDPYSEDITVLPAAWVSVSSSLSETEPDVSLRKDFPGIGSGTSFLTRAQFGQPHSIDSSNELAPMYIHCENDVLETTGNWDDGKGCKFANLPNPEIVEIEDLENELEITLEEKNTNGEPLCLLNEDLSECERLVLGTTESGEQIEFSNTFKLILNLAGNKFDVEPAAILVYMHKLGVDKKYAHYWSEEGEEDLKKASLPWYGGFPFCDDLEPVKQAPYDWKLTWFSEMLKQSGAPLGTTDSPKTVLKNMFGRQDTASRCNFIDSTFTLAGSLARMLYYPSGSDRIDVKCSDQNLVVDDITTPMNKAMKIQYYQLQYNPEKETLKGELDDINIFKDEKELEYKPIWDACK